MLCKERWWLDDVSSNETELGHWLLFEYYEFYYFVNI